jgi:Tfp pilus assembly protein PilW
MSVVINIQRKYVDQRERVRAQESLRVAQMTIATVLRAAGANPRNVASCGVGQVNFGTCLTLVNVDPDNNGTFDDLRVISDLDESGTVSRFDAPFNDDLEDVHLYISGDTLWVRWQAGAQPQPLAFPIDSLRFEYYANNGTMFTDAAQTVGATRAKFILYAPRDARTTQTERTEAWWVNMRNRQGL